MTGRVLQFGTSRFLQAHADLFIDEARREGQRIGLVTVVKTTHGAERAGRIAAFADPAGFPVRIRGLVDGRPVDREQRVQSVGAALDAHRDWDRLVDVFAHETDIVISNTGEAGYALSGADRVPPAATVPAGFPAKLLWLLQHRHDAGARPLLILPCELVTGNGQALRSLLTQLAQDWGLSGRFQRWLSGDVTICDTLVDRIVSEALDPIGAVAEPYALWAIRRAPGMAEPFHHPCVIYTDDLEPYTRLKLHILNLGHSWLAELWRSTGRPGNEVVRQILSDRAARESLVSLYQDEVIPGFAARGMRLEATRYVAQTLDRFDNPFLDHRLSDIAQNHALKIERRVAAFLDWVRESDPTLPLPRLARFAAQA